jgi:predicted dehydrogenase
MTDASIVRLAIVGAGIMGTNHARVARMLRGGRLVAVVDRDTERAAKAAAATGARVAGDIEEVLDEIDAAVIAVPTEFHHGVACSLAERGIHLLVEKPLAETTAQAEAIATAAASGGVVLAVGHVERFNAAVAELPRLLDRPIHVDVFRVGAYSPRISDGVVFDLMIHDIDIVLSLVGPNAAVDHISGISQVVHGVTEDLVCATLRFSNGLTATLNTSRLGQQKVRRIEVTQQESVLVADLLRQDVTVHRMTRQEYLSDEGTRYRQSSIVEMPFVEVRGEPLLLEQQNFIDTIRGEGTLRVDGNAGVAAVRLATQIQNIVRPPK